MVPNEQNIAIDTIINYVAEWLEARYTITLEEVFKNGGNTFPAFPPNHITAFQLKLGCVSN